MKEKANTKTNRNRKRSSMSKLFARTSSMPNVTRERDWQTDVPNIKLSRAFVVVLIIHVVALGGILAFEMFKPKAVTDPVAMQANATLTDLEKQAEKRPPIKSNDPQNKYISHSIQSGDSLSVLATRYSVTEADIMKANRIDNAFPLTQGRVLRIPKNGSSPNPGIVSTNKPNTVSRPPEAIPTAIPVRETPVVPPVVENSIPDVPAALPLATEEDFASLDSLLSDLGGTPEEVGSEPASAPVIPAPVPVPDVKPNSEFDSWNRTPEIVKPDGVNSSSAKSRTTVVRSVPTERVMETRTAPPIPKPVSAPSAGGRSHKVKPGQTLYAISREYGVSVAQIQAANRGLDPSKLSIGQVIRIPR